MAANQLSPKFYQELMDKIKNGQPVDDMLSRYNPAVVRDILEEAQAQSLKGKNPFDAFEQPELFSNVKVNESPNMKNLGEASYFETKGGLADLERPMEINLRNKNDIPTKIHEATHIYDQKSKLHLPQPKELSNDKALKGVIEELGINRKVPNASELKGLEEATSFSRPHFKPDDVNKMKQVSNLERILNGRGMKMIAPLIKGAGIGAMGLAAAGIGNKAMAGDFGGAAMDAVDLGTDLTPVVGEVKSAINPTMMGNSELPPEEMDERSKFNRTKAIEQLAKAKEIN